MNYNTQNAKIASITEKTLIVGIDVGSETHYARALDWRNYEYSKKPFAFGNDEAGFAAFKAWMEDMADKHGKAAVIPGMEPTSHYWLNLGAYLQEQGMKLVHVNPHHVKKSKELDDNNPNKNDRKDPKTIAGLVNEGRFSYPYIPTGIYAEIRNLSNLRIQTQEEITRIKNRIARWFSIYFPEMKDVYKNPDAVSGIMVIKKAPLPCDIKELGVDGVNKVWRDAKLRGAGLKRARPWLGAELTPWLWTGGTREVRTQLLWADDPGRHGRFAAVDGWVYTRPCRTKTKTFYFVYPKSTIFVPDTEKCPFLWLLLLRYLLMIY